MMHRMVQSLKKAFSPTPPNRYIPLPGIIIVVTGSGYDRKNYRLITLDTFTERDLPIKTFQPLIEQSLNIPVADQVIKYKDQTLGGDRALFDWEVKRQHRIPAVYVVDQRTTSDSEGTSHAAARAPAAPADHREKKDDFGTTSLTDITAEAPREITTFEDWVGVLDAIGPKDALAMVSTNQEAILAAWNSALIKTMNDALKQADSTLRSCVFASLFVDLEQLGRSPQLLQALREGISRSVQPHLVTLSTIPETEGFRRIISTTIVSDNPPSSRSDLRAPTTWRSPAAGPAAPGIAHAAAFTPVSVPTPSPAPSPAGASATLTNPHKF